MPRILIIVSLLICLALGVDGEPGSTVLILPGHFSVMPGGAWSEPEGEEGAVGPTHLIFQAFTSQVRPKESLILGAVKIVDSEKIPDPARRTMDAQKMVQFMLSSLRPSTEGQKLEKSKPTIRPLDDLGPAKSFYSLTLGAGEDVMIVSGITMDADKGAAAIQFVRPKSSKGNPYDATFWKRLIKTIKPLKKTVPARPGRIDSARLPQENTQPNKDAAPNP